MYVTKMNPRELGDMLTCLQDPCAPFYDPKTDLYHVSYQSSLDLANADWGDIAWRSATSKDLVSWDLQHEPALTPDTAYDGKGVFTGCKVPSRDDSLTYVYTSIGALPIHHTLPHIVGSESLSMAKSFDNGKTWQKSAGNPILPSEPTNLEVTGWRDPFVSSWPSMAVALGRNSEETLFGIISGGIRDITPTTFLYAIDANDLAKWEYIGPLVNFGLNLRPSRWSGDMGRNWEVTNFVTLKDESNSSITRDLLVMGTEGCLPSALSEEHSQTVDEASEGPSRPIRGQLWMSGSIKSSDASTSSTKGPVQMQYGFGGHLDHGCLYAANSFFDTKTSKHIVWGWITEEDLCDDLRHKQGWSGLLSLPREIHLQTLENVVGAWKSDLKDITSVESEANSHGTYTVRTLASEPVTSVVDQLRHRASIRRARLSKPLPQQHSHDLAFTSDDVQTTAWELDCSFSVSRRCSKIGLQLVHSRGKSYNDTAALLTDQSQTNTHSPRLLPHNHPHLHPKHRNLHNHPPVLPRPAILGQQPTPNFHLPRTRPSHPIHHSQSHNRHSIN